MWDSWGCGTVVGYILIRKGGGRLVGDVGVVRRGGEVFRVTG